MDLVDNILQEISFVTGNLKYPLLSQTVFQNVFKTYHGILDHEKIFYNKIITIETLFDDCTLKMSIILHLHSIWAHHTTNTIKFVRTFKYIGCWYNLSTWILFICSKIHRLFDHKTDVIAKAIKSFYSWAICFLSFI